MDVVVSICFSTSGGSDVVFYSLVDKIPCFSCFWKYFCVELCLVQISDYPLLEKEACYAIPYVCLVFFCDRLGGG